MNSFPPGQNGRHFAEDTFRCIFMNENFFILIDISVTFVPTDPISLDNDLVPKRRQAIIWSNADPIHRRIYMRHEGEMS